ncbi:unnamed protein product [Acanthoscelides obtectus]|uniref:Nuclease HARBI1 n=1 Tax=Acanthoscelides obtectus TaxID=200917 RepID=A0A9P0LCF6_ACAOB|nr:unnamed protein product [Acanthoscelides obtectus]CAK1656576.1 hypothetical protein AOBTE_LOCUS19811 [Acanthoscelides obtectus]
MEKSYDCKRHSKGLFQTYFKDVHAFPDRFFNYTRMSVQSFDNLLEKIRNSIKGIDTRMRACISPEEKLVITLRYLATGCSMMELSHNYRIGHTTVRDIIYEVCMAIWENMRQSSFPELNEERWLEIAKGFNENANYPNCVGAIDGKHIRDFFEEKQKDATRNHQVGEEKTVDKSIILIVEVEKSIQHDDIVR